MKVLLAHNHYGDFAQGGEQIVFEHERDLLQNNGHEVKTYERTNSELSALAMLKRTLCPSEMGWSKDVYDETTRLIKSFHPDILHVHNYKYVITASIFEAARDLGVAVVLSLHNYRLICPGGQLRRGEIVCEECLQKNPIRSLWRSGCSSKLSSRIVQYLFYSQTREQIINNVNAFIIPTCFGRQKLIEGGIPAKKIWVKPYSVLDCGVNTHDLKKRACIGGLYVGRLSVEKGVRFLIDAWREVDYPLTIIGDGPELELLKLRAGSNVRFMGALSHERTLDFLQHADFLLFPSVCYEGLGMTLIEACSMGTPTIASNLGGRSEIIEHDVSGLLFESGNKEDFLDSVRYMIHNPSRRIFMGQEARRKFESAYTPERNIFNLIQIYKSILL